MTTSGLVVDVVSDGAGLDDLAPAWEELYAAAPRATQFQSHAWISSWWRSYGRRGRLAVVLVREGRRLLAVAPFEVRHVGPVRVLAPLGGAVSDFSDVLVAERGTERSCDEVLDALADALVSTGGWDAIDLPEVRPDAVVRTVVQRWRGRVWSADASTCMELSVAPFPAVLTRLPAKRAREFRRVLRRSDELGLVVSDVAAADVPGMIPELLTLHEQQWAGRGGNPEHRRPRFAAHLVSALSAMVERGQAAVMRYELDGRVLAGQVVLVGHDLVGGYFLGVSPDLYARMDFSTYVVRADLERADRLGLNTYTMLRGTEPYKDRWGPTAVTNRRLVLGRPGSGRALGYDLAVRGRAGLVAEAKQRLPGLRSARQRWRSRGRRHGSGGPGRRGSAD